MIVNFADQFLPGGPVEQVPAQLEGEGDVLAGITGGDGDPTAGGQRGFVGGRGLPEEFIEELQREFGLDKPPFERFMLMMWNYMRFDFGEAISETSAL